MRRSAPYSSSPIPTTGIPLSVSAAAFKGTAPNAAVAIAVEMRPDGFKFAEKDGTFSDRVQVALSSVDAKGTVRPGQRHVLTLEMSAATAAVARERGLRVVSEVNLPPGRYQLRVGAAEEGAGRSGSAFYDLDVPDFQRAGLSMSGVALTSAGASGTPTVRAADPLKEVLPGPPVTVREFGRERSDRALHRVLRERRKRAASHRRAGDDGPRRRRTRRVPESRTTIVHGSAGQQRRIRISGPVPAGGVRSGGLCDQRTGAIACRRRRAHRSRRAHPRPVSGPRR